MESKNRSDIPGLTELRGAAALLVFFYHSVHAGYAANGHPDWPIASNPISLFIFEGHTAVALFMVLSAYLLASGTFGKEIIYREFIRKRALRIFPLMFVVIVFSIAGTANITLGQIIADFALMANTSASFSDPAQLSGTLWTAAVEFQFYLIAPFLFALVGKQGLRYAVALCVFFFLLRIVLLLPTADAPAEAFRISYYTIAGRINQFMIGIAFAYLVDAGKLRLTIHRSSAILAVSIVGLLGFLFALNRGGGITHWEPWHVIVPELEGLLWVLFLVGCIGVKPFRLPSIGPLLRFFGEISYGMYLLHFAIQYNFWSRIYPKLNLTTGSFGIALWSVALLTATVLASWLSFRCIEYPFQKMGRSYLKERPTESTRRLQPGT